MIRRLRPLLAICAATALIGLAGCSNKLVTATFSNLPPVARLTAAPPDSVNRYYYSIALNWTASDPDGRVDHFLFAIDPPVLAGQSEIDSLHTKWTRTDRSDTTIQFRATRNLFAADGKTPIGTAVGFHTYVLKAVDDHGAESAIQRRDFYAQTVAPEVRILHPSPSDQSRAFVTPAVLVEWDGDDIDGVYSKKPVKYKWIMLNEQTEFPMALALEKPDSLRTYYAIRNWAGWDSTSSDTTYHQFTSLVPNREYLFVVVAFDEAGAYSPTFTRRNNMLLMRVTFAGNKNPTITMFNDFFSFSYPSGSYEPNNPARVVFLEIPAGERVTFNWFAIPIDGSRMRSYRWALDIQDLNDETPRTDEETDLAHWSPKSLPEGAASATIGPFDGSNVIRRFYIEAEDINGLKSLGQIAFLVVEPTWDAPGSKPLLVVKDMRLFPDQKRVTTSPCVDPPPSRAWPTQAELDTFLFAQGGFPWRCYGPAGTMSSPGLFKGYNFDTLGTRIGRTDLTVRLSRLVQYHQVVWITDLTGGDYRLDGASALDPQGALRYMTAPNRTNTLATYIKQGGRVWLCGGAGAFASLDSYDKVNNNTTQPAPSRTYSFENNELIPGRLMYDHFKWQSEVKQTSGEITITKLLGYHHPQDSLFYAGLPRQLGYHNEAEGDTFPVGRTRIDQNFYYNRLGSIDYLSRPNPYTEDLDPGPAENLVSGLDTLYEASGGSLVPTNIPLPFNFNNVIMTVYPSRTLPTSGPQSQMIYSGFDIWSFQKKQCKAIVDFVCSNLWNLQNPYLGTRLASGVASARSTASGPAGSAAGIQPTKPAPRSITSVRPGRSAVGSGRNPR